MYDVVVDLEIDLGEDRKDPSPYQKSNVLSGIGWLRTDEDEVKIWEKGDSIDTFVSDVNSARYVVCHNAKFDISWLRECGINVTVKLIDTMINQYILNRGVRGELSLKKLAEKYDVTRKTDDLADAMQKGMNWSDLDIETRRGYLESDVRATAEIYKNKWLYSRTRLVRL